MINIHRDKERYEIEIIKCKMNEISFQVSAYGSSKNNAKIWLVNLESVRGRLR